MEQKKRIKGRRSTEKVEGRRMEERGMEESDNSTA